MSFVDGFVIPVPTARKQDYIEFAARCAPYFLKHGAVSIAENWGTAVPDGQSTSFPHAVKLQDGETVVFSWVVWPDQSTRDAAIEAVMVEMEADGYTMADVPFDGKRMIVGGFETIYRSE